MDLLSGVVRNRKMATVQVSSSNNARQPFLSFDGSDTGDGTGEGRSYIGNLIYNMYSYLFSALNLRVHRFVFQWNIILHMSICVMSLTPFFLTGSRLYSIVPISVWTFYNFLFFISTKRAEKVVQVRRTLPSLFSPVSMYYRLLINSPLPSILLINLLYT